MTDTVAMIVMGASVNFIANRVTSGAYMGPLSWDWFKLTCLLAIVLWAARVH